MQEYGKSCGICHSEWICRDINFFVLYNNLKSAILGIIALHHYHKKSIAIKAILFYIYDVIIITCGPLATFDLLFLFSAPSLGSFSRLLFSAPSFGSLIRLSHSAPSLGPLRTSLLAALFGLDALCGVGNTHQTLLGNEFACCFADAVGLVLDAHQCHLQVTDKLHLVSSQTTSLLL